MFVNVNQHKIQIIIGAVLGIIIYIYTLSFPLAVVTTLGSSFAFRHMQLDKLIENYIYV